MIFTELRGSQEQCVKFVSATGVSGHEPIQLFEDIVSYLFGFRGFHFPEIE